MADRIFDNSKLWQYESICHEYGLNDSTERIEHLLRVLKTRDAIDASQAKDPDVLYTTMVNETNDMPRFKGDAKLFSEIYSALCSVDTHDILSFITRINMNDRHITIPDVLTGKFSEYITAETETVLVPECEEFGTALLDLIEANPKVQFTLTSRNQYWLDILSYIYGGCANTKLEFADIYIDGFNNERYNLIFCVPVFGAKSFSGGQDFICKESDMIAVQNLLYHIDIVDGRLVIVLPARITFAGGSVRLLRDYIQTNYSIKEISAMPSGMFAPWTAIKTYMFCFSNGITEDVLIRKYETNKPIRRSTLCTELNLVGEEILFPDEFADLNGWNIEMAFNDDDDDLRAYNQSSVKKVLLKDIASIFRGKAVNNKTDGGTIGVVNISNLTDAGIDYTSLELLDEEERKVARYALEDGDVLVTSRGTTIKVGVFEKQEMTCIPSANFNVIRPDSRMRGQYLKIFLESPIGSKLLKSLQRGTTVMNINYKDLGELEVPLLPLEDQDAIIADYNEGLSLYRQTIATAEEAWSGVKEEIRSRLY